jgi:hypothetical protein
MRLVVAGIRRQTTFTGSDAPDLLSVPTDVDIGSGQGIKNSY